MNRQVIFALLLIALDAAYFIEALSLQRPFLTGEPGPAFMPFLLCVALLVAAMGVLVEETRGTVVEEKSEEVKFGWRTVALIFLTCAFIAAFEPLGYWIATLFYTFSVGWLFEQERIGAIKAAFTSALIAACITGAGWLFFVTLFELFLPEGNF